MNVLFVCNKSPYPPREGAPLAINANIQALLKAGHRVKVLALNTNKYFIEEKEIPPSYREATGIEFFYKDLSIRPFQALANLFSNRSLHVERFVSKDMKRRMAELLQEEQFDVVQIEILYMTPYVETVKKHSNARVILRSHNVEHLLWERISEESGNILKKWYLKTLARRLKNYELGNLNTYDGIITISAHDAAFFREAGCTIPLTDVPFGVKTEDYKPSGTAREFPSLFHLGSMNWLPNEEGIRWFLDQAWPLISEKFPELKLYLAGRMMPDWLNKMDVKNVDVLGEVPDARMFMLSKGIMVVPLFSGSGIRIKIIEGMALGKTIISTSLGAEGINYTHNKNIIIADDAKEFLNAVEQCVTNKRFSDQVGEAARKLILQEHSLTHVLKKLEAFYRQVLEKT